MFLPFVFFHQGKGKWEDVSQDFAIYFPDGGDFLAAEEG